MGRTDKLFEQLAGLETDFEERLVEALSATAKGGNQLLFMTVAAARQIGIRPTFACKAEEFLRSGHKLLKLRKKLKLPIGECLATRFIEACEHWSDASDHHRGSAQSVARRLLEDTGKGP